MLAVMQLHNLSRDDRLQGIALVRQFRQGVLLAGESAHGCNCLPRVAQEGSSGGQHSFSSKIKSMRRSKFTDWGLWNRNDIVESVWESNRLSEYSILCTGYIHACTLGPMAAENNYYLCLCR